MGLRELDPGTGMLVRAVRERRFAAGLACPRCGSGRVLRWGHFAGRQRYRCQACERCFSDLTATSLSHLKRLDAWPAYCRCLSASESVRRSAVAAGVSVRTSFRWRHRILGAARDLDPTTQLSGLVEFADRRFPYSTKGYRRGGAPPWTPAGYFGQEPMLARPGCIVVVARDRTGAHLAERVDTGTLTGEQLRVLFDEVVADTATLLCSRGRFSPYGWLQRPGSGGRRTLLQVSPFGRDERAVVHNRNAQEWLWRLSGWLVRFRGVATKYLPNYLEWRQLVELLEAGPWLTRLIPCAAGPSSPTTPGNSDPVRGPRTMAAGP